MAVSESGSDSKLGSGADLRFLSRIFDFAVALIVLMLLMAAFHVHAMLTIGDWDFWVDWKDERFWVVITPVLLITFPAAFQYIFWENFRLPFAATLCLLALVLAEWITRVTAFNMWAYMPFSMVWPATLIPGAIVLDLVLMLTGNMLMTAIFGGMAFGLMFYPGNWPMLAAFMQPVDVHGSLMSVADQIGYTYTRTSTPEYLRIINRGTLRTFGGSAAPVSAFFSAFLCIIMYMIWWQIGKFFCKLITIPNVLRTHMGYGQEEKPNEGDLPLKA